MTKIANVLRRLADHIDPQGDPFRALSVASMNRYIGRTERYVVALERLATVAGVHPKDIAALRAINGRFDTANLVKVAAWDTGEIMIDLAKKVPKLIVCDSTMPAEPPRVFNGVVFSRFNTAESVKFLEAGRTPHFGKVGVLTFQADKIEGDKAANDSA